MIVDSHLHCSGNETPDGILRALDEAKIDVAVLLAPMLTASNLMKEQADLRDANRHLGKVVRGHGDRLVAFAVVDPLDSEAATDLRFAVEKLGLRGLKLVPSGWYPYEESAHRIYECASELRIPVLFHSGIFIDGRSGRFCRPVFFEALRDYPSLRVTLAHLGWPWCDEANAVGLIDLIKGVRPHDCQFRFDISFGPPPVYRLEVLKRAVAVLGPELLQFGSDRFLPCAGSLLTDAIEDVRSLFGELNLDEVSRRHIMGQTAACWLGLKG